MEGDFVRIGVLGPMQVKIGARVVPITAERDRVVLAMLLLNAGNPVSVRMLAEAVWTDHLPQDSRNQLQGCVSRLRRHMVEAGGLAADDSDRPKRLPCCARYGTARPVRQICDSSGARS
jgi:DNA-binding SARP family transcriptional activator